MEWTVEQQKTRNIWELLCGQQLITTSTHYSILQLVADAHNAAVAAGRNIRDATQVELDGADKVIANLKHQLAAEREKGKQAEQIIANDNREPTLRFVKAEAENKKLRQQLLQAHEVLKRIRLRHSNNDSTTREIDALIEVKQ